MAACKTSKRRTAALTNCPTGRETQLKSMMAAISGHGFGHLSQVSPVLNELTEIVPDLTLHVRSPLPKTSISGWLDLPFQHIQAEDDVGMCMRDALQVDRAASLDAYSRLHEGWDQKVDQLGEQMLKDDISLVLVDVPYLPLAAAQSAGIPTIALGSLNWADIVEYYFPEQAQWVQKIRSVYRNADTFLTPTPAMKMPWLANQQKIGPVGRQGTSRRRQLNEWIGLPPEANLVLAGMGGMRHPMDLTHWPKRVNGTHVHYIVSDNLLGQVANCSLAKDLPMHYVDLIASSDLVISKPGYGMFVEAAAAGVPVLYVRREGWPDVQSLTSWLHSVANAAQIEPKQVEQGDLNNSMAELLSAEQSHPIALSGVAEAAALSASYLH